MTQIRQRSCITCGTQNSADTFLCRNCRGILDDDAELIEKKPEKVSRTNGRNPVSSPNGSNLSRKKQDKKLPRKILVMLSIAVVALLVMGGILVALPKHFPLTSTPTPTPTLAPLHLPAGLGVYQVTEGEYIGINDGQMHNGFFSPIDVSRLDNQYEIKAAKDLSNHDENSAIQALQAGMKEDTNDAEAGIYWQNIVAVDAGNYVSLVVAVDISPSSDILSSRRILQGAYIAQKEFNDDTNNPVKLRLLIANSGGNLSYVNPVAQQIVKVAQQERVVGVLGWQTSSSCHQALATLAAAHIPMVSETASSDDLANQTYFFRVSPNNATQAAVDAAFAFAPSPDGLDAKSAIVFFDPADSYSNNITGIAADFEKDFKGKGGKILAEVKFTTDKTAAAGTFPNLIRQALNAHPTAGMLYFAGVDLNDAGAFENALQTYPNLPAIGADASYDAQQIKGPSRWYVSAYAFHDEWSTQPTFFSDYKQNFDSNGIHGAAPYDYDIPHAVAIVSYDAAEAFIQAIKSASQKNASNITSQQIDNLLPNTNFQGMSGQIVLGSDHNPKDKALVVLRWFPTGFRIKCISGNFGPDITQATPVCPT